MNKPTSPGMLAARRRRMCNEYANVLLQDMRILASRAIPPINPPLNMGNYNYFAHFQKVATTIVSIIQHKRQ